MVTFFGVVYACSIRTHTHGLEYNAVEAYDNNQHSTTCCVLDTVMDHVCALTRNIIRVSMYNIFSNKYLLSITRNTMLITALLTQWFYEGFAYGLCRRYWEVNQSDMDFHCRTPWTFTKKGMVTWLHPHKVIRCHTTNQCPPTAVLV